MATRDHTPDGPRDAIWEREGESLALLADEDPDEAAGLAAWAAQRHPWPGVLDDITTGPAFRNHLRWVEQQRRLGTIYPAEADVFAALHLTPFQRVSVVILGQDPYHRPGLANGLAFSVPRNLPSNKFPASLRNIRVALTNDGFTPANHGDLMPWARQGVLLLNTALTVSEGAPNSHKKEWRAFTNTVISRLSARDEPVVFVLWGNEAIKTCDRIDKQRHRVVTAPHPSARGSYQRAFRTSGTFAKINQRLTELGRTPIDWEAC